MAEVDGNIGEPIIDPPVDHDEIDHNEDEDEDDDEDEDEDEEQTTEPELDDAEGHGLDMHHGIDQTVDHEFVHALEQGLDESADQGDEIVHELEQAIGHNADHHTEHSTEDAEDQTADTFDEQGKGNDQEAAAVTAERRWPGWPGESVFRMLVPAQKVGGIIGRKGEFIKKIVEETRARVKILDGPPGTTERVVMVSGKEEPDSLLPPALDGLLRVHKRVVDGLDGDSSHPPGTVSKVSTRLLVPASQAGSLIGKQGGTVKSIQETAGCMVKVLGSEELPVFALQDDRVVELVGQPAGVHKAVELIASHLRKFLVDRSIIQVFEMQMANPHIDHIPPPHQPWGAPQGLPPPNAGGGLGYGHTPQYMPPPRQLENYYPPPDMPPPMEKTPHQGISAYGREAPPVGAHASSNAQTAPSMITQITQQMQIPLSFADAVIGTAGASISYIRRASGATVTIQETRGAPGEMTVEISGSASQVQAAQQLVQNFMAEAGHTQPQTGGAADQGYNPYAAHSSMYASPQNPSHGGYGSAYGTNYGY